MATPQERLAASLAALARLQKGGTVAIRSTDLSRTHRERLLENGFLREIMKGWYIPVRPGEEAGESTAWYTSFWDFFAGYLTERFGTDWCLSPEQSLSLQAGNRSVPRQLLVRSPRAGNKVVRLPHGTSLLDVRTTLPSDDDTVLIDGLRLFSPPAALIACSPRYFEEYATDARAALATIQDSSEVLDRLLEGGHSTIAGRLAGAFRNIRRDRIADAIRQAMGSAGYEVRERDPFERRLAPVLPRRAESAFAGRTRLLWQEMRAEVIARFPKSPGRPADSNALLDRIDEVYVTDAYHSLSIEGYRVSPDMIERVRTGDWNPDGSESDRQHRDALAARGYWQAFQVVKKSVRRVLEGENPGTVAEEDHSAWYREMFAPSVAAGLIATADLAGYRNGPVFIRRSMHVPPRREAVLDAMPVLFELLAEEGDPAARAVLGHWLFVYVHPYPDGNGRIGRFLMNVMLVAGGYPWTVVPLERRDEYMAALEAASVGHDIAPFTTLLSSLVTEPARSRIRQR